VGVVHALISGIFTEAIDLGYTEVNPAYGLLKEMLPPKSGKRHIDLDRTLVGRLDMHIKKLRKDCMAAGFCPITCSRGSHSAWHKEPCAELAWPPDFEPVVRMIYAMLTPLCS
jgi:hypothetical protein